MKSRALAMIAAALVLAGSACTRSGPASATATAAPQEKHYALTGEVISVDAGRKILFVRHNEVPGLMPAMAMEFDVSAGDAAAVRPGEHIRADLIPSKVGNYRLEKIWPDDKVAADTVSAGAQVLHEDTHDRGNGVYREIGEKIPEFALYDQDGRVVQSTRFHGKQIMINFIYTRCPVATMCPASTLKMMATQKLAREAGVKNLELISITLDPAYDTPGVLKEYASARAIDTSNFSFLTGPEAAIKDLLAQFGVSAEFKGALLVHSLATLLINQDGKIIHRADGSAWEPEEFVAKMHKAA